MSACARVAELLVQLVVQRRRELVGLDEAAPALAAHPVGDGRHGAHGRGAPAPRVAALGGGFPTCAIEPVGDRLELVLQRGEPFAGGAASSASSAAADGLELEQDPLGLGVEGRQRGLHPALHREVLGERGDELAPCPGPGRRGPRRAAARSARAACRRAPRAAAARARRRARARASRRAASRGELRPARRRGSRARSGARRRAAATAATPPAAASAAAPERGAALVALAPGPWPARGRSRRRTRSRDAPAAARRGAPRACARRCRAGTAPRPVSVKKSTQPSE